MYVLALVINSLPVVRPAVQVFQVRVRSALVPSQSLTANVISVLQTLEALTIIAHWL